MRHQGQVVPGRGITGSATYVSRFLCDVSLFPLTDSIHCGLTWIQRSFKWKCWSKKKWMEEKETALFQNRTQKYFWEYHPVNAGSDKSWPTQGGQVLHSISVEMLWLRCLGETVIQRFNRNVGNSHHRFYDTNGPNTVSVIFSNVFVLLTLLQRRRPNPQWPPQTVWEIQKILHKDVIMNFQGHLIQREVNDHPLVFS